MTMFKLNTKNLLFLLGLMFKGNSVFAWTQFQNLGGGVVSVAASSWGPGRYDIFGVANDGSVWHKVFASNAWKNWYSIGGAANGKATAYSIKYNWIDVMYTGKDKKMYRKTWNGNSWIDWQVSPAGGLFMSGPSITSSDDANLHVFGIGLDSQVYHCAITISNNQWSTWEVLGGSAVGDPAAVSWGPGRFDVFVIAGDQQLWQKTYEGGWKEWNVVSGGKFQPGVGVTSKRFGCINVFMKGLDDSVYHRQYDRVWGNLENIGGKIKSSPSGVSSDSTRADVFVVGPDNAVYWSYWELRWPDLTPSTDLNIAQGYRPISHTDPVNYGCYKSYCWSHCKATAMDAVSQHEWCYTTKSYSQSFQYVTCRDYVDCNASWKCAGSCTV